MRFPGVAVSIAVAVVCSGCRKQGAEHQPLAHVGSRTITAADLQRKIDESSPLVRARYATVERRRELLESMVREELLAQEADRRHLDKVPAVQEQLRRAMVQELLRSEFEGPSRPDVGDAEARRYYEQHTQEFVRPDMARLAHLFLVADARNRSAVKAEAEKLRRDLDERQRRGEATAFADAVRKRSNDPATRESGGALRFMNRDELAAAVGLEAARAGFALQPGEIAGPFATERGFEIVRLEVKTVGVNRSFPEVRDTIRAQIARQSQSKTYEQLIKKVREGTEVKIDEAALTAMPIRTSAPATTASTP